VVYYPHMRRFVISVIIITALAGSFLARPAVATISLAQRLSGRILFQVQSGGAFWYVYPINFQRYNLGDSTTTFNIMQQLSLPMSQASMDSIPVAGSTDVGNLALRQRLSGRIIRISATNEHWYISPVNLQRYQLDDNPFGVLKSLSLGITDANLKLIPIAAGFDAPKVAVNGLLRVQKNVATSRGTFLVDVMTLDTAKTTLKVMTDTAQSTDCTSNCRNISLKAFIDQRGAVAGIHGTYFCPYDYASCVGQTGSFLFPVYNSFSHVILNSGRVKYTSQPLVAFDTSNHPFFYSESRNFHSPEDFLTRVRSDSLAAGGNGTLRAAISNGPIMMVAGVNTLDTNFLDTKQATVKSYRGALGWKGTTIYFMVVHGATVIDSAAVMQALGLDYAINLDGGGSTAMYQGGGYVIGPGRNLPNVILLVP